MIPLRDVIPSRSTPYITVTLIVINAVAWLYELTIPGDLLPVYLQLYGVVPADFSTPTLVSSMFLHGSWSHFIGNMWYLWIFGDNVEDRVGHGRFIAFYLLCGVAAALGHVAMDPSSTLPTIGASGAIAGVMGAYLALYPTSTIDLFVWPLSLFTRRDLRVPAWLMLGLWFAVQVISGVGGGNGASAAGGVAFFAHIGGFITGLVLALLVRPGQRSTFSSN